MIKKQIKLIIVMELPKKTVKTSQGDVDNKIINLYARGMSTRDISDTVKDIYGVEVSAAMISKITDKIIPKALQWQNRPLDTVYPIVFIDCVHFNVKTDNMVTKKAAYVVLGVNENGYKEIFGSAKTKQLNSGYQY